MSVPSRRSEIYRLRTGYFICSYREFLQQWEQCVIASTVRACNRATEPSVLTIEACHSYKIHINVILPSLLVYTISGDIKSVFPCNRLFYSIKHNNNINCTVKHGNKVGHTLAVYRLQERL